MYTMLRRGIIGPWCTPGVFSNEYNAKKTTASVFHRPRRTTFGLYPLLMVEVAPVEPKDHTDKPLPPRAARVMASHGMWETVSCDGS